MRRGRLSNTERSKHGGGAFPRRASAAHWPFLLNSVADALRMTFQRRAFQARWRGFPKAGIRRAHAVRPGLGHPPRCGCIPPLSGAFAIRGKPIGKRRNILWENASALREPRQGACPRAGITEKTRKKPTARARRLFDGRAACYNTGCTITRALEPGYRREGYDARAGSIGFY